MVKSINNIDNICEMFLLPQIFGHSVLAAQLQSVDSVSFSLRP